MWSKTGLLFQVIHDAALERGPDPDPDAHILESVAGPYIAGLEHVIGSVGFIKAILAIVARMINVLQATVLELERTEDVGD